MKDDKNVILDWLESLSENKERCIDPLPDNPNPGSLYKQVVKIIDDFSGIAKRAHASLTLPSETDQPISFVTYLDKPRGLLEAMIRGGWIIPGNSTRSMFISRILKNEGPMQDVFDAEAIANFVKWIDEGANFEDFGEGPSKILENDLVKLEAKSELALLRPFIGQGAVH